jgi:hypothetical protein
MRSVVDVVGVVALSGNVKKGEAMRLLTSLIINTTTTNNHLKRNEKVDGL